MPIYTYQCRKCDEKFESFRGIFSSDKEVSCPKCGAKNPQRLLSPVFTKGLNESGSKFRFPT